MIKRLLFLLLVPSLAWAIPPVSETRQISVTPTVTASSIYTAKDSIGGLMTFTGITCPGSHIGKVSAIKIADKADNAAEYDVVTFKSVPTGTITDKTAFDPTDADLLLMNPFINIATTDHSSFFDNGISSLASLFSVALSTTTTPDAGTLYLALIARGSPPTFASTSDITITLFFTCD